MNDRIEITVPATSANLGPGFDCLGMAVTIENHYTFQLNDRGIEISGCPEEFRNRDHLTVRAFDSLYREKRMTAPGLRLHLDSRIPISRGLGSSAACILAGLTAANVYLGYPFSKEALFERACRIEGHPDNVAPAFFGGLCAGLWDEPADRFLFRKFTISRFPHLYALVPDFHLSTEKARSALPSHYAKQDVVATIQHLAWLLGELTQNDPKAFSLGFDDRIHQPYRSPLIPDWEPIRKRLSEMPGCAAFISGSGPAIMVWARDSCLPIAESVRELAPVLKAKWEIWPCALSFEGLRIVETADGSADKPGLSPELL